MYQHTHVANTQRNAACPRGDERSLQYQNVKISHAPTQLVYDASKYAAIAYDTWLGRG